MTVLFLGIQDIFGKVNNGGIQCSKRNYQLLQEIDNAFVYVGIITESCQNLCQQKVKCFQRVKNEQQAFLAALRMRKYYGAKAEKEMIQYIEELHPDILFLDSSNLGGLLKKISYLPQTFIFFHNIERDYTWNKVKKEGARYIFSYIASRYNEKVAATLADKIICLNERDSMRLQELYQRKPDCLLPISFEDTFEESKVKRSVKNKKILFIGSCFGPNYEGIKWFIKNVMKKLPEYQLEIVGKGFEQKKEELECPNVTVTGTVDYLEDYYYSAAAIVMPIQYGCGMKVKTAEAMMYGVNILATDEALEGYTVNNIKGIYRCNYPDEFIAGIKQIYEAKQPVSYQREVRDYFLKYHNQSGQVKIMQSLMES